MIKKLFLSILTREKGSVAKTLTLSLLVYALMSLPPILLGRLVDQTVLRTSVNYQFYFLIFAVALLSLGLERLFSSFLTDLSSRLIKDRYVGSVRDILEKERRLFETVKIGEIIDVFSRFISGYEGVIIALLSALIPSMLAVMILLGAVFIVSNAMVLLTVASVQVVVFYMLLWFLRRYATSLKQYTISCYQLSDAWVELLGNNKVIQSEFSFDYALRRLNDSVSRMADYFIRKSVAHDKVKSFVSFGQTLSLLMIVIILVFYLRNNVITVGTIITVIALNSLLSSHMRVISDFMVTMRNFANASNDFLKIQQAHRYLQHGKRVPHIDTLCLKPLDVVKNGATILTLENEFTVHRGERICVLGLSGAGKTTFLSLFFNAHRNYQDKVHVNGIPVTQIDSANYQALVRISFQENELLSGQGYVEWFQREVDKTRAEQLLARLYMPHDIVTGERRLEPWSSNISGGEAKRLNIARLLIAPGDVNVLDEPTAGLNVSLSKRMWELIFSCLRDRAILCATQDLTYLQHFDRVLIIDDGKVAADIPPSQLEENPFFLKIRDQL